MAKSHSQSDAGRVARADSVAVIGMGRFGRALALELMASGTEVLGIDFREDIVQELNGQLTHVVQADSTKEEALRQLALPEFDRVVVAIGHDVQSSILTTSILLGFNIEHLWVKAVSAQHGRILEQLGVKHVVFPEGDMGRRVAHLVRGSMQDFLEIGDDFSLIKMAPPPSTIGKNLTDAGVRTKFGVTVVAVRRLGGRWNYATADTMIEEGDTLLVAGSTSKAEAFSQLH
ncbi:trk system potassium uptake protein TrkA [Leifsonia sp. AK011]|uniref:potassium channel family protein n=1 Tax=Leifsonia sp. AK011 TaxID=2723075 RepID=UPI0017AEE60C|nr:TrkA family potassium uptake protein [Leifsonia sp. AK011]NYF09164.1 trk system potassium uptake protein TrkA [Leifsonia sp. AK011]